MGGVSKEDRAFGRMIVCGEVIDGQALRRAFDALPKEFSVEALTRQLLAQGAITSFPCIAARRLAGRLRKAEAIAWVAGLGQDARWAKKDRAADQER